MAGKVPRLYPCSPMKSPSQKKSTPVLSKLYLNCVQWSLLQMGIKMCLLNY